MPKPAINIKWNEAEFNATLRKYALVSKRALPDICNKKALFIARGAIRETPAVSADEIKAFINSDGGATIGKIINARRAAKGEKGLQGKDMAAAVKLIQSARLRSRSFLKSGWIWAIRQLAPLVGASSNSGARGAKAIGKAKGRAEPARPGWRVVSKIINTVTAAWDKREGADKIATPALQRAFDKERLSMEAEIERRLKSEAHGVGIKTR
jgi:hypothetical protein